MESINTLRSNGTGFLHLSRRLQPGETVPHIPSLADQLLACRLVRQEQPEPVPDEALEEDF
ncbi:MAG TPA: hypothetical protein VKZ48_03595 [Burkholderiales bacterium]|nr:hypothetical protein [Burkholderiales bacterium]